MTTSAEALEREGAVLLREAGIDQPRFEARLLLQHATGFSKEILIAHPSHAVTDAQAEDYRSFIRRRSKNEPVAYIVGRREFWSLDFAVSPAVLVPRPDSETLIEAALANIPDRGAPLRVLDLGTGSGCLLLALLSELPNAYGVGIDLSAEAAEVARTNADALGISARAEIVHGDWTALDLEPFDVVLSNPPYIPDREIGSLAPDVRAYEPRLALSGGADGLSCYRTILTLLPRLMNPRGFAAIELGAGQSAAVSSLVTTLGYEVVETVQDLCGIERCLLIRGKN